MSTKTGRPDEFQDDEFQGGEFQSDKLQDDEFQDDEFQDNAFGGAGRQTGGGSSVLIQG